MSAVVAARWLTVNGPVTVRVVNEPGGAETDTLAESVVGPLPPAGGKMYIKCPTCSTLMNRKLFATGAGVVVDVCRTHGTFFDAGELPAIIEFVRAGGLVRVVYERSLAIALFSLFFVSLYLHVVGGAGELSRQRIAAGEPPITAVEFLTTPDFWFQSMQNWQSEFLSVGALVILTVFLRQKGSSESKPVDEPHHSTG